MWRGQSGTSATDSDLLKSTLGSFYVKSNRNNFFAQNTNEIAQGATLIFLLTTAPRTATVNNFPFGTGLDMSNESLSEIHGRRKMAQAARAAIVGTTLGTRFELFAEGLVEVDQSIGQSIENLIEHFKAKRNRMAYLQGLKTTESAFPGFIPQSAYNVSTCDILSEIQRHFLEPVIDDGVTWSDMWTQAEVLGWLNNRIQRFQLETGLIDSTASVSVGAAVVEYNYPTDLIEMRRAVFNDGSTTAVLSRSDEFQMDNGRPGWETETGAPEVIIEEPRAALSFQLAPDPTGSGTVDLHYLAVPVQVTAACVPLPFPAMFSWAVKYGVMADMLSKEGEAQDAQRATYCEGRWQMGIELAKLMLNDKAGSS